MKFKTIRGGQEAVIYNHLGEGRLIKGPARVFLFRERLKMLEHFNASQYQYLMITYNTGIVRHIRGPCEMFCNPLEHRRIVVKDAVKIDANHMIVVYKQLKDNSVERRIIQGPQLFVPAAEEWLHKFSWHGEDENRVGHVIPNHQIFEQLPVIPAQFYYDIRDVRTNDDTMITVKLMLFYELKDVIKMLECTQDPVADMINAVCADIMAFAGKMNFQQFLQATGALSELSTYTQLLQRTERIGYHVTKVVYRGYQASKQLQAMQDSAIQSRTEIRLNAELQKQEQKLRDFRLQREKNRTELSQKIERQKLEHQQKIETLKSSHQMLLKDTNINIELQCEAMRHEAELEYKKKCIEHQLEFLSSLHKLDTDLTEYLTHQGPKQVDEEVNLVQLTA